MTERNNCKRNKIIYKVSLKCVLNVLKLTSQQMSLPSPASHLPQQWSGAHLCTSVWGGAGLPPALVCLAMGFPGRGALSHPARH